MYEVRKSNVDGPKTNDPKGYDRSVTTTNRRGEWVPSIPLPFLGFRKKCRCGEKFWTMRGYEGHYARDHILGMD